MSTTETNNTAPEAIQPPGPLAPNLEAWMNIDPTAGFQKPRVETYNRETGEYDPEPWAYHDGPDPLDDIEYPPNDDENNTIELHSCYVKHPHQGYKHATTYCQEDMQGRFWLVDVSGRNMTQVSFCPFCGVQCLDDTPPDKPVQIVQQDVALTPADKPTRVWVQHKQKIMMRHFQFGSVKLLASDGCHAKVLTDNRIQVTVCVENLEPIKGERMLPKVGGAKVDKPKKERGAIDPELMAKYLDMGMD